MTAASLRLRILAASVDVVYEEGVTHELAAELRRAWARCLDVRDPTVDRPRSVHPAHMAAQGAYRAHVVTDQGASTVAEDTLDRFASELTSVVTVSGIEARAGDLLMLHAAGLADPATGRSVALVGPSGMGKTTATRTLGAEWGYVTDETVAVDRSGAVVPYAKPLSVIVDSPHEPKRQVGPDELGLQPAPREATLGAVVLLDRRIGAGGDIDGQADCTSARVVPVSHADALIELAPHTSSLARIDRPLQWLCSVLDACGGAVRVTYGEASELGALVGGLLKRPRMARDWAPAVDGPGARRGPDCPARGLVRRADVVDAVQLQLRDGGEEAGGEELIAMVGHRVVRLGGIAPAIWRALATPLGLEEIAQRIGPDVGLPDGYEPMLAAAIAELEANGLLRCT